DRSARTTRSRDGSQRPERGQEKEPFTENFWYLWRQEERTRQGQVQAGEGRFAMTRLRVAFPATVLLFSLSVATAAQSLVDGPGSAPVAPRVPQAQPPSPAQSPVIVVRPDLNDEQMADLYMARKEYREASQLY